MLVYAGVMRYPNMAPRASVVEEAVAEVVGVEVDTLGVGEVDSMDTVAEAVVVTTQVDPQKSVWRQLPTAAMAMCQLPVQSQRRLWICSLCSACHLSL